MEDFLSAHTMYIFAGRRYRNIYLHLLTYSVFNVQELAQVIFTYLHLDMVATSKYCSFSFSEFHSYQ